MAVFDIKTGGAKLALRRAAAALADMRDGIVFDPQDSLVLEGEAALQMARENEVLLPKIEASLRS